MQHSLFFMNLFYLGTAVLCCISSFPGVFLSRNCSAFPSAFPLFHKSRLYRNCPALHHPVFSWNLFYQGTVLLCSILSLPGIYSIQEPLCSISSRLFQESFYPGIALLCSIPSFPGIYSIQELLCSVQHPVFSRNCNALQHHVFSRNCSALQHPIFSRNLFYPETALLHAACRLFQEYIPSRNCFALQHRLFSRNIFHSLTAAQLCRTLQK